MDKIYRPQEVEERLYRRWEEKGYFRAEVDPSRRPFCIVIPPPNVTGSLHIGHALNNTVQDVLVRWKRMQGFSTLWLPGTDHAGIATQAVVERELAKEGLTRQALGREAFLSRVWEWKEKYEREIIGQLKKLGCSCDWSRTRFTLDPGLSRAVEEVFVRYYEKGLIYRGDYMVNWCPRCGTAISDLEVEHREVEGRMWTILYPFADGSPGGVEVATTRPETMLGDTAVAVHPGDGRYRHLVGRELLLPLVGRRIPVVADEEVDPEFGTGAVKVTPAHDPLDFEIGRRHGLERVQVVGFDGRMTEAAPPAYRGLDRSEARKRVVEDLREGGFLRGEREHRHAVGHCHRCGTVVEPLVSRQWFVRMKPLARPAMEAVEEGRIRFVPERFSRLYLHWLENVRDWCISRQLWWGHRIPAWECRSCGEVTVRREREAPSSCPRCGSPELERDPDVLDTWFSSALWPFSTLGWPEETAELRYFFPTDVLVTGYDIIFFWVARMVFSSLEFTGQIPFRWVLVTGLVRDAQGRKMSKSLGTGVDPLEVIARYGADTLRYSLLTGNSPGNDQRFSPAKVEAARNFLNKIWNASRLAFQHLGDFDPRAEAAPPELADRWILSRLQWVVAEANRLLDLFELGEAARTLQEFFWGQFCDWYLELAKPRLYGQKGEAARRRAQLTLVQVLDTLFRLFHPFIPFITEELWLKLPGSGESLVVAPWPEPSPSLVDRTAEEKMEDLMEAIRALRHLRAEFRLDPTLEVEVLVSVSDGRSRLLLEEGREYISRLARVKRMERVEEGERPPGVATAVAAGAEFHLLLSGLVDVEGEKERFRRELGRAEEELARVEEKLRRPDFLERAPAEVVEKERARREELGELVERLRRRLRQLEGKE